MGGYICYLKRTRIRYHRIEEVDFFAIYVLEKKTWFILPARVVLRLKSHIRVAPGMKEQKYARYEEAWHLLRRGAGGGDDGKSGQEPTRRNSRAVAS